MDSWTMFCDINKMLSQIPNNILLPKSNYPQDLPPWYTENDEMIDEIFPDDLFFDPYKTISEEMQELEKYEQKIIEDVSSDEESDEYSDYEWDMVKNKF